MHPLKNEKYQLFINLTLPKREFQMSLCGVPKKKKNHFLGSYSLTKSILQEYKEAVRKCLELLYRIKAT